MAQIAEKLCQRSFQHAFKMFTGQQWVCAYRLEISSDESIHQLPSGGITPVSGVDCDRSFVYI